MRRLREDEIESRWSRYRGDSVHPVIVLLENVRSVYNVGAIFRTSDAAALEKIIICGITATPENRSVHKTALGSENSVDWEYVNSAPEALAQLRKDGYRIAALEITDQPTDIRELTENDFPLCVVIGSEVTGVSDESLQMCDLAIELPQFGEKHSLNAAVAFGVAIYAVVGQYHALHPLTSENVSEGMRSFSGSSGRTDS